MASIRCGIPVVLLATAVAAGASFAPIKAQTRSEDVLPSLLIEVKGLRAAMEKMASSSAQSQLLVGRLQLQEGRINNMIRRLDVVRDALGSARRELEKMQAELKNLQAATDEKQGFAALAKMFRPNAEEETQREIAADQEKVNRLAAEEAELMRQIATEQARWVEINQRLDDLEKSLAKR